MLKAVKKTSHEIRGMLADMSTAATHPATLEKPASGASNTTRLMYSIHSALHWSGRLANRGYDRKIPRWPVETESISVLGYGAEKIAYRVLTADGNEQVISVYHRESMGKKPLEVIQKKQKSYEMYKKYFGDLVVPTLFTLVDNPWGSGSKPATIQPLLTETSKLDDMHTDDLRTRAANDSKLKDNVTLLVHGYHEMLEDGLCPDFASSNVLTSGSEILLFDTGRLYAADKLPRLSEIHPTYELIGNLAGTLLK